MLNIESPQYLKRWQIPAVQYDPQKVTVRILLSHIAGLTVHGFADYSQRRSLPTLVQMLEGQNQLDGAVKLFQEPRLSFEYSGGGYVLLQMILEDVSGLPFAQFIQAEVIGPLGLTILHWTWTPELAAAVPVPYGPQQETLEYRPAVVLPSLLPRSLAHSPGGCGHGGSGRVGSFQYRGRLVSRDKGINNYGTNDCHSYPPICCEGPTGPGAAPDYRTPAGRCRAGAQPSP